MVALAISLLATPASRVESGRAGLPGNREIRSTDACSLCDDSIGARPRRLDEKGAEAIGTRLHEHNVGALARVDSLYRSSYFGPPRSSVARREARRCLEILTRNSMDYIADLSITDGEVFETDSKELARPFFQTFVNPGVYPVQGLVRARTGRGGFCMQYNLDHPFKAERIPGRKDAQLHAVEENLDGVPMRMLKLVYPSGLHSTLDVLYEDRYCGHVERREIVDRGDTLDLTIIRDIRGSYVSKGGIHRVDALVFWRGRMPSDGWREGSARVGAVAYFPEIHFSLPWFLPDFGLDDLRDFDLPQPLWLRTYHQKMRIPEWLDVSDPDRTIKEWKAEGPRPAVLDRMFPDL
jgi:hypothetical protein